MLKRRLKTSGWQHCRKCLYIGIGDVRISNQRRSRAAYWDGKNEVGESVASGDYFYTLTAGDFTATRKLLIQTINEKLFVCY